MEACLPICQLAIPISVGGKRAIANQVKILPNVSVRTISSLNTPTGPQIHRVFWALALGKDVVGKAIVRFN